MGTTEPQSKTVTKLSRIAFLSKSDPHKVFNQLMHHYNAESLKECFKLLDGKKAVGIDGVCKELYQEKITTNLE